MNNIKENESVEPELFLIRKLIEEKAWDRALVHIKNELSLLINYRYYLTIQILDAYENYILAMHDLEQYRIKAAIEKLNRALELFSTQNFEMEIFNTNFQLACIYSEENEIEKATKHFLNAWKIAQNFENLKIRRKFLDKFLLFLIKISDYQNLIKFQKEKLFLINKKVEETEYIKTVLTLITYLVQVNQIDEALSFLNEIKIFNYLPIENIQNQIENKVKAYLEYLIKNNEFENALELIRINKFQIDSYIELFEPLFNLFMTIRSLHLAKQLAELFQFQVKKSSPVLESWKKKSIPIFIEKIMEYPWNLLELEEVKYIVKIFLKDEEFNQQIIYELSKLTEYLLNNLNDKHIIAFLHYIDAILSEDGINRLSELVHSWISINSDLKRIKHIEEEPEINQKAMKKINAKMILDIYNQSRGTFAPLSLLKNFFEEKYKQFDYQADIGICNELADFLFEINEISYGIPENTIRETILDAINIYNNTITSGYEYLILQFVKSKEIDNAFSEGNFDPNSNFINHFISDISLKNPLPFSRSIENMIAYWLEFLLLEKTDYIGTENEINSLKSIFRLLIFQEIVPNFLSETYQRRFRNDKYKYKILMELVRANIDYLYYFWRIIQLESSIPHQKVSEYYEKILKYLKHWIDKIKFTQEELLEIINSSSWKNSANEILLKLSELKNHCIYCSNNIPSGMVKCLICGCKSGEGKINLPIINIDVMRVFIK